MTKSANFFLKKIYQTSPSTSPKRNPPTLKRFTSNLIATTKILDTQNLPLPKPKIFFAETQTEQFPSKLEGWHRAAVTGCVNAPAKTPNRNVPRRNKLI